MMKRRFILNPKAGKGGALRGLAAVQEYFTCRGYFECIRTKSRQDTIQKTLAAVKEGCEQLVVLGGDGTLNAVVNGILQSNLEAAKSVRLVVTPWGTGADYFRSTSENPDWMPAVEDHQDLWVDVGKITFEDIPQVPLYFINAMSVGISADVVRNQDRISAKLPGLFSYSLPILKTLARYSPTEMQISVNGEVYEGKFLAAFAAKGKTIGGGMKLGGGVSLADGKLDITLIRGMPLLKSLQSLPRIYSGHLQGHDSIIKTTANELSIKTSSPLPVEFDGEIFGTTGVHVSVLPKALRLCVPRIGSSLPANTP